MPSRLGVPHAVLRLAVFAAGAFAAGAAGFDPAVCAARDATPNAAANTKVSLRRRISRASRFR
jgi:hypothetical protein